MKTPDITPAAITALVLAIVTNAVLLFGLDLTDAQRGATSGLITAVVLAAFLIHDAIIRQGRAKISAAKAARPVTQAPAVPVSSSSGPAGTTFVATASAGTPKTPAKPRTRTRTRKTPPKT